MDQTVILRGLSYDDFEPIVLQSSLRERERERAKGVSNDMANRGTRLSIVRSFCDSFMK